MTTGGPSFCIAADRCADANDSGDGGKIRSYQVRAGSPGLFRANRRAKETEPPKDWGGIRASTNCSTLILLIRRNAAGPTSPKKALLRLTSRED